MDNNTPFPYNQYVETANVASCHPKDQQYEPPPYIDLSNLDNAPEAENNPYAETELLQEAKPYNEAPAIRIQEPTPNRDTRPVDAITPEEKLYQDEILKNVAKSVGGDVNVYHVDSWKPKFAKVDENSLVYFLYRTPQNRRKFQKLLNTPPCCMRCTRIDPWAYVCFPCSLGALCSEFCCNPLCCSKTPLYCSTSSCGVLMPDAHHKWADALWLLDNDLKNSDDPANAPVARTLPTPSVYGTKTHDELLELRKVLIESIHQAGFEYDDCYPNCCCRTCCAGCYWAKYGLLTQWYAQKRYNKDLSPFFLFAGWFRSSFPAHPDSKQLPKFSQFQFLTEWSGDLTTAMDFHDIAWGNQYKINRDLIDAKKYHGSLHME